VGREKQPTRRGRGPTPGFWIKFGLVTNLAAPALPPRLSLLIALIVFALPARLFEA
jgi:hypothetical protein